MVLLGQVWWTHNHSCQLIWLELWHAAYTCAAAATYSSDPKRLQVIFCIAGVWSSPPIGPRSTNQRKSERSLLMIRKSSAPTPLCIYSLSDSMCKGCGRSCLGVYVYTPRNDHCVCNVAEKKGSTTIRSLSTSMTVTSASLSMAVIPLIGAITSGPGRRFCTAAPTKDEVSTGAPSSVRSKPASTEKNTEAADRSQACGSCFVGGGG